MTYRTALNIMLRGARDSRYARSNYQNAVFLSCIALRKQEATKPIQIGKLKVPVKVGNATFKPGTSIVAKCPRCNALVNSAKQYYCDQCGQKLREKRK